MKLAELSEKELVELETEHSGWGPEEHEHTRQGEHYWHQHPFCHPCGFVQWPCKMARLVDEVRRNRARQGVLL